jgi:hypothetical protein
VLISVADGSLLVDIDDPAQEIADGTRDLRLSMLTSDN